MCLGQLKSLRLVVPPRSFSFYHVSCPKFSLPTPRLLELNPGPKIMEQARQVLTACEKAPTDAVRINYDPRNPFDICPITFTPVYKGSKYLEDPYTGEWPCGSPGWLGGSLCVL